MTGDMFSLDGGPAVSSKPKSREIAAVEAEAHWMQFVNSQALNIAAMLNLVGDRETALAKVPDPPYSELYALCADLRKRAVAQEINLGARARNRLHGQVNRELWSFLVPHRRVVTGGYDVSHLSADVPRVTQTPDITEKESGDD